MKQKRGKVSGFLSGYITLHTDVDALKARIDELTEVMTTHLSVQGQMASQTTLAPIMASTGQNRKFEGNAVEWLIFP